MRCATKPSLSKNDKRAAKTEAERKLSGKNRTKRTNSDNTTPPAMLIKEIFLQNGILKNTKASLRNRNEAAKTARIQNEENNRRV